MTRRAPAGSPPGSGALFATLGVFVVVGVPLVYVVWEAINRALSGNLRAVQPAPVFAAAVGLAVVLFLLTRVLRRWSDGA